MIIQKYILKELFINLMVIIFSMSVILFMEKFVRMTRLFMGKGADFIDIAKVFLYLQPSILLLSIPMSILIAAFITYGRMSTDGEIVVLKGSGMSFWGISKAAIMLSALCFFIVFFISLYLLPRGMHSLKKVLQETIIKKASMTLEEETFSDVFKDTVIFVKDIPSKDKLKGIFVFKDANKSVDEPMVIVAEKGVINANPEEGLIKLSMKKGMIHTFKKNSSSEISFAEYDFVLTSGIESASSRNPDEIKTMDLWKGRGENILWSIELNRRIVLPFACLIFGILAPAFSIKAGKIGRLGSFSLSMGLLIFYYMLLILGEGLAESGKISTFLGGWAANMFFGAVAVLFYYIAYRDKSIKRL